MFDPAPEQTLARHAFSPSVVNFRIGVSGHRTLENPGVVCAAIHEVLTKLETWFSGDRYSVEILSQLADGVDRLAAHCVLDRAQPCHPEPPPAPDVARVRSRPQHPPVSASLAAVLPMPPEIYCHSFLGVAEKDYAGPPCDPNQPSVREFHELLRHAQSTVIAPLPEECAGGDPAKVYRDEANRHDAHRRTGNYIVENCDLLLVVWDGKKVYREGSTYQNYLHARKVGRSCVVVDPVSGALRWEFSGDDLASQYDSYDKYRDELQKTEISMTEVARRYSDLVTAAERASLSQEGFPALNEFVLPVFLRARNLAAGYQSKYYRCGMIGYASAAAAVFVGAALSMLLRDNTRLHLFYFVEAVLIVIAAVSGYLLKNLGWQRKWIDYRYLAERLRATCYLYIAGIEFEPATLHPDNQFHWLPAGWVTIELREVWKQLPELRPDAARFSDPQHVRALGSFLYHSWILSQQRYYEGASEKNGRLNERLELASIIIVVVTLVIAVLNAIGPRAHEFLRLSEHGVEFLHYFASCLPAVTGALAGIMVFRHFSRNEERYRSMSQFLRGAGTRILDSVGLSGNTKQKPDLGALRREVQIADHDMAHEHEGWRTVFGVRLPGPG